jgi:hypothetical protein
MKPHIQIKPTDVTMEHLEALGRRSPYSSSLRTAASMHFDEAPAAATAESAAVGAVVVEVAIMTVGLIMALVIPAHDWSLVVLAAGRTVKMRLPHAHLIKRPPAGTF